MLKRKILAAIVLPVLMHPAAADTLEKQFDDLFRNQQKFEANQKRARNEGIVLQRFRGRKNNTGTFSIGGGRAGDDRLYSDYQTDRNFNTGTSPQDPGIVQFRLRF